MSVNARQTRIGINIATSNSWSTGTAVATAVGAGDGHRVRDDIGVQLRQMYSDDDSAGQSFIGSVQAGNTEFVNAAIPMYLHYSDVFQNVLWALAFGTGGTSPVQIGATTAYSNTFEPATNKDGKYCTIVRDKSQYVSEVPGAKCTGFEISFGEAGRAEVTWNFLGDREVNDSVINTATQISALTFPAQGLRAFFKQAVLRLNAQGGGALAGSDKLFVTSIRVSFAQTMDQLHVAGAASGVEPAETDHLNCMIDLTFARFDTASDAFFDAHRDVTLYKGDLTLTGPAIATTSYAMLFQFPNLAVTEYNAPIPGGGGNSSPTMRLKAYSTTAAPTGMTGVTVPIRLTTTGSSTTNPFA